MLNFLVRFRKSLNGRAHLTLPANTDGICSMRMKQHLRSASDQTTIARLMLHSLSIFRDEKNPE